MTSRSVTVFVITTAPYGSGDEPDEAIEEAGLLRGLAYVPRIGESIYLGGDTGMPFLVSDVWHDPGARNPVRVWLQDHPPGCPLVVGRTAAEADDSAKGMAWLVRDLDRKLDARARRSRKPR